MKRSIKNLLFKIRSYGGKRQKAKTLHNEDLPMVMCTVFKNEAPFLKEWIEFHQSQGFQRFYLIDNFSDDGFEEVLQPFLESGVVNLFKTKSRGMSVFVQSHEFTRALKVIRKLEDEECWVAFMDVDEYLFSVTDQSVREVLDGFIGQKVAAVLCNWLMFGTSGVKKLDPERTMISQLIHRAPDEHDEHRLFKPIVYLPNAHSFYGSPHLPLKRNGATFFYSDGTEFRKDEKQSIHSPLRINHYWYRSEEYYRQQKTEKRKAFGYTREKRIEDWHKERCNQVEDQSILAKAP